MAGEDPKKATPLGLVLNWGTSTCGRGVTKLGTEYLLIYGDFFGISWPQASFAAGKAAYIILSPYWDSSCDRSH